MPPKKRKIKHRPLIMHERLCFVIMPFGEGFDDRYNEVYAPGIRDSGLRPLRADSLSKPSPIIEDVWRLTRQAALLLADLTSRNVNVFYELGLAHGIQKPAVLVTDSIAEVPFDLRSLRILIYNSATPKARMQRQLTQAIYETLLDPSAALPAAFVAPKRGFEESYRFGGSSVGDAELDLIAAALDEIEPKDMNRIVKEVLESLSKEQRMRFLTYLNRESALTDWTPEIEKVKSQLADLGKRFPDSLLAEMIWAVRSSGASRVVSLLVETGFARNSVEANIMFDLVEWAVYETGIMPAPYPIHGINPQAS